MGLGVCRRGPGGGGGEESMGGVGGGGRGPSWGKGWGRRRRRSGAEGREQKKVTNKKSRTSYSLAVNMRAARFMFREQL